MPNFCNLGVMLRSMIVVNILLAAAAVIRAPSLADGASEMLAFAAFGEPMLIVSLAVLCLVRRFLVTLGYGAAYFAIAVFELALAYSFHLLAAKVSIAQQMPFAQLAAITVFVAGISLAYFDFRARALSPAVAEGHSASSEDRSLICLTARTPSQLASATPVSVRAIVIAIRKLK